MKMLISSSKSSFSYESHKFYQITKSVKNVVINHLKSCFQMFSGPIHPTGYTKQSFSKNIFSLEFLSFLAKNAIFSANFFCSTRFSAGNRQTAQKFRPNVRNIPNPPQKNFGDNTKKIGENF